MIKGMKSRSRLAWKQADFVSAKEEIPEALIADDFHTEGELLSREEIVSWLVDTNATFCLVREQNEKRFNELYEEFTCDLEYLKTIGKITPEEAHDLTNSKLYKFEAEE